MSKEKEEEVGSIVNLRIKKESFIKYKKKNSKINKTTEHSYKLNYLQ